MAFNLFGLLPDPDEAEKNAPQLAIDDSRLSQLREGLTGLSETKKDRMREQNQTAINKGKGEAKENIENSTTNPATAIAQSNRLDEKATENQVKSEQFIQNKDLETEQIAEDRYGKEYEKIDAKKNENKVARETARAKADNARKGGLAQIGGKLVGAGLSLAMGPAGMAVGDMAGNAVAEGVTDDVSITKQAENYDGEGGKSLEGESPTVSEPRVKGPSDQVTYYTVQEGDTFADIAQNFSADESELLSYNPQIRDPESISEGQKIAIEPFSIGAIDNLNINQ